MKTILMYIGFLAGIVSISGYVLFLHGWKPFVSLARAQCVGCTKCVTICPGLAIYLQWINRDRGYVTLPYEQLPEPSLGDEALLYDRSGKTIGIGTIVNPTYQARGNPYPLWCVTVEFNNSKIVYDVRAIQIIN
jgi:ferredoxin